jgi:hypothetical protein
MKHQHGGIMVGKAIVTLACCALIAPLAVAQSRSAQKGHRATTTEAVTVTGTVVPTPEEGAATKYQPVKTLVVREERSNNPGRYVLNRSGRIINKWGEVVQTTIKPGSRVLIYYINTGALRVDRK